ncbi:MAG: helix-turn-helix domain-containing protein [Synergistaceae bacterium]|nr:helix-turn-helix domain-containing protein [Synergistaceae bacterium]
MAYHFTQPENTVMFDTTLSPTVKVVYCAILKHIDKDTKKCLLYMKTLAQDVGRSVRTIQRAVSVLIDKGLITRQERYAQHGGNSASCFALVEAETDNPDTPSCQERQTINNTSFNDNYLKGETPLDSVPEVMRPTARYLMQRTGRKGLSKFEVDALKALAKVHTPARVQKEIDRIVDRFRAAGRSLRRLTVNYLQTCLGNQQSYTPKKKPELTMRPEEVDWLDRLAVMVG